MANDSTTPDNGDSRIRRYTAVVLAVVAAIAISLSMSTIWMHERIFDTDTFVETLAPLPRNPAVSDAIAMHAVEALTPGDTIERRIAEALPDQLGFMTPKFTDFAEELVFDTTKSVVESDAFMTVWTAGLRRSHAVVIGILDGDLPTTDTGYIGVEFSDASDLILDSLGEQGIDLFADVETAFDEIILLQAEALAAPRSIVNMFHTPVWVFPILAVLLLGGAVALDPQRIRPIEVFGFTTAGLILAGLAFLQIVSGIGLNSIADPIDRAAVDAVWDTLLNGYAVFNLVVVAIGTLVGFGAMWWRHTRVVEQ